MAKKTKPAKGEPAADTEVLFVRLPSDLMRGLEKLATSEAARTGYPLTKTDVVRKILTDAVKNARA
jgi:hypothetical protein